MKGLLVIGVILYALVMGVVLAGGDNPKVTIRVTPSTLVCVVSPSSQNRWLAMGIEERTSHGVQLDGLEARITHMLPLPLQTCDEGSDHVVVFCEVTGTQGSRRVVQNVVCRPVD